MPFRSSKQRAFLWANHPEIAKRWTDEHGSKIVPSKKEESGNAQDEETGLPLNRDGTVTVYHHTSAANAAKIKATGILKSVGEPHVYVTTHKQPDTGYGEAVVQLLVNPRLLMLDDEFPDGRQDFRISVGKPGGSIRIKVGSILNESLKSTLFNIFFKE